METARLAAACPSLPAHVQAELAVRRETVTPWWWGLRTLIKVWGGPHACMQACSIVPFSSYLYTPEGTK
jgi:hypothetical protein